MNTMPTSEFSLNFEDNFDCSINLDMSNTPSVNQLISTVKNATNLVENPSNMTLMSTDQFTNPTIELTVNDSKF